VVVWALEVVVPAVVPLAAPSVVVLVLLELLLVVVVRESELEVVEGELVAL